MFLETEKINKKIDLNIEFMRAILIMLVLLFYYQFLGFKVDFIRLDIFLKI